MSFRSELMVCFAWRDMTPVLCPVHVKSCFENALHVHVLPSFRMGATMYRSVDRVVYT